MVASKVVLAIAVSLALVGVTSAFYIPGVDINDYAQGATLELKVRQLTSTSDVAFSYYDLGFCTPEGGPQEASENLGEYLQGTEIYNSPYVLKMLENTTCNVLCPKSYTAEDITRFSDKIDEAYHMHWMLDNLPAAHVTSETIEFHGGFPIGGALDPETVDSVTKTPRYLLNHHHITVEYHVTEKGNRVVGFYVLPVSVVHENTGTKEAPVLGNCPKTGIRTSKNPLYITGFNVKDAPLEVIWSYDVTWIENAQVRWASRWDVYLTMDGQFSDDIHWFSIANSFVISLFLTGMVGMILARALYKDLSRYNRVATDEEKAEDQEETGWKLVHADVFRPPTRHAQSFAVVIGVSTQVLWMAIITICFAAIGYLSPANRGGVMLALVILFLLLGAVAGYSSARVYKSFKGKAWQKTTLYTALLFPGFCFFILFVMNLFLWGDASSQAIPFGSMFAVLAMWFALSIPLVFVGAYYGFRREAYKFPVSIGAVPRPVPDQVWYLKTSVVMLVGILPFGSVFVEVVFILTSLWLGYYYYLFGFLLLAFVILLVTCAEIAIVLVYFQLCAENYHWWWRSFFIPASAGLYLFGYCVIYYASRLSMSFVAGLLYFGYMGLISLFFSMVCGCAGYYACFWFTRKIYAAIKVD